MRMVVVFPLLVKEADVERAVEVLRRAGHTAQLE
jgi:hypothetical protein